MRAFSVALVCLLILTGCRGEQTRKDSPPALEAGTPSASESNRAQLKSEKQLMVNSLNDVVAQLQSQGIEVRKTRKKHPWRLIVPALEKVSPGSRQAQAKEIAANFKLQIEPLMHKPIDVDVFATPQETDKLN